MAASLLKEVGHLRLTSAGDSCCSLKEYDRAASFEESLRPRNYAHLSAADKQHAREARQATTQFMPDQSWREESQYDIV